MPERRKEKHIFLARRISSEGGIVRVRGWHAAAISCRVRRVDARGGMAGGGDAIGVAEELVCHHHRGDKYWRLTRAI